MKEKDQNEQGKPLDYVLKRIDDSIDDDRSEEKNKQSAGELIPYAEVLKKLT